MIGMKTVSPRHFINRCLLAADYLKKNAVCRGFPNEITVEMTNHCNLRCIMCPREKMKRPIGFMKFELFKKIIDDPVVRKYVELVDLDLYGESLLHPDAVKMIEYCKSHGLNTMVSTNLTHMTAAKAEAIVRSGLDAIILSFDGATKETYEKIRRGGNFEQSLENLRTLLAVKERLKSKTPFTTLQMIYMKDTQKEAEEFLKKWRKSTANVVRLKPFLNLDKAKTDLSVLPSGSSNAPCIMLWRKIAFYWDGTSVPCCNDYDRGYVIGDANKQTVSEIWNGRQMQAIRRAHAEGSSQNINLCKGCKPFEASTAVVLGSVLVDDLTMKKLLPIVEKMVIKSGSGLLKYS